MTQVSEHNVSLLSELILLKLDGQISAEQMAVLDDLLVGNAGAQKFYLDFITVCSGLSCHSTASEANVSSEIESENDFDVYDQDLWLELAEAEKNAPAIEIVREKPVQEKVYISNTPAVKTVHRVHKPSLYAAILSAAALLLMIIYVKVAPPAPYEVATVSDSIGAEWSSSLSMKPGTRISSHSKPIHLTRGIVKLLTDDNVEVILEGPCEFSFISYSEVALNYGKLFARVSDQGLGFSVSTPNSKVVDLGTEFGVLCQLNGDTEVYMYKGKANLLAGKKSADKTSELLEAGAGRKIDNKNCNVKKIAIKEHALVRNVDSTSNMVWKGQSVSLANIVGGGNGFKGGIHNVGVDVTTGDVISEILNDDTLTGPKGYVAVGGNPYIDGVFVPGITGDTTQVASDGTLVSLLPETSGAMWGYIFNGAMHKGTTTPEHNLKLNGTVFGTSGNAAINIHSNQGITFDLARISGTVPGLKIKSFKSLIGISSTVQDAITSERGRSFDDFPEMEKVFKANCSKVDFWVFLDGKKVFHKEMSSAENASEINIPITAGSRFLTLAVTESDDTHGYDWALFGRPELQLDSAN